MILEYVLNPANLIFYFFLSLRGKGTSQSKAHGQDVCFLFFFFKGAQTAFSLLIRAVFVSKNVSLIYVSHLPSWQAYVVV